MFDPNPPLPINHNNVKLQVYSSTCTTLMEFGFMLFKNVLVPKAEYFSILFKYPYDYVPFRIIVSMSYSLMLVCDIVLRCASLFCLIFTPSSLFCLTIINKMMSLNIKVRMT